MTRSAVAALSILACVFGLQTPAHASSGIGLSTIVSVTTDPAHKRVKITYNNRSALPPGTVPTASARYYETSRAGNLDSKQFSTRKGTHTLYLSTRRAIRVVTVEIGGVRGFATKSYTRLVAPGTHTTSRQVTAADAIARVIVVNAPGAVLSFAPQTRLVRIVGLALLGWTLGSDFVGAITGSGGSCPTLSAGQYITSSTSYSQSGASVKTKTVFKVWHSFREKKRGKGSACTVTSTFTYR